MNPVTRLLNAIEPIKQPDNPKILDLIGILRLESQDQERLNKISAQLTLADLKVSFAFCPNETKELIQFIAPTKDFDNYTPEFSLRNRIQVVSDVILKHVNLSFLQFSEEVIAFKNTDAWYALAPDEMLLERPLNDMNQLFCNPHIVASRLNEIWETRSELLHEFKK